MTRTLIYARSTLTTAALSFTAGAYTLTTDTPWLCLIGFYGSALFAWIGARLNADHQRERAVLQRLERLRHGQPVELPDPCCNLWQHSNGAAHANNCSLPYDARRAHLNAAWAALADTCCLRSWETRGHAHDAQSCRDQSRSNAA